MQFPCTKQATHSPVALPFPNTQFLSSTHITSILNLDYKLFSAGTVSLYAFCDVPSAPLGAIK